MVRNSIFEKGNIWVEIKRIERVSYVYIKCKDLEEGMSWGSLRNLKNSLYGRVLGRGIRD